MKTLYQALCIGGMALMAVSCDYTDLQPTDQIGDEMIFSSVSALEQTSSRVSSLLTICITIGSLFG